MPDVATQPRHVEILIVGSGFAGLGAAIKLTQAGKDDFVVIERGSEVGGTWRDNTYPGAVSPVLIFVRAEPELDPVVLLGLGDPAIHT